MADTVKLQVKLVLDTKELERVLKKYQGQQIQIQATMPGVKGAAANKNIGKTSVSNKAGYSMKDLIPPELVGAMAKMSLVVAGLYAIKKAMDFVNAQITEIKNTMAEINPAYGRQEEIMKKMYNMALLPMSQLMTMMMKPYLQMMIIKMKEGREKAAQYFEDYKTATTSEEKEEAMQNIMDVVKETSTNMAVWQFRFDTTFKPLLAEIEGFRDGLAAVNQFLTISDYWLGVAEGTAAGMVAKSNFEDANKDLVDAIDSGAVDFENLDAKLLGIYNGYVTAEEKINDAEDGLPSQAENIIEAAKTLAGAVVQAKDTIIELGNSIIDKISNTKRIVTYSEGITHYNVAREGERYRDLYTEEENGRGLVQDFISRPGQPVQSFSPSDTIVGMKDIGKSGSGEINVTINVSGEGEEVAYKIKKELVSALYRYGRF